MKMNVVLLVNHPVSEALYFGIGVATCFGLCFVCVHDVAGEL
jgi:hypothetical protein